MLRRSHYTPTRQRDQPLPAEIPRLSNPGAFSRCDGMAAAVPKAIFLENVNAERAHKTALAGLGCMVCLRLHGPHDPGPVELHHLRTGGWGKGDYRTLIPLCVEHHRGNEGVHGLGTRGFDNRYGFGQRDLLDDALRLVEQLKGQG